MSRQEPRSAGRLSFLMLDYLVRRDNAIGNTNRTIVERLTEFDFHVFALDIEDDLKPARFTRIPAIRRPLFALFLSYHLLITVKLLLSRPKAPVISIESNSLFGDVVAVHFCHRAYLADHWAESRPSGLRRFAKWLDHKLHAVFEPFALRRAKHIVAPSKGLARELERTYPRETKGKINVIPNPVEVKRFAPDPAFSKAAWRERASIPSSAVLLVFVALGHFERKGLPLLLSALARVEGLHLLVVGGQPAVLRHYRRASADLGLGGRVHFIGPQRDVREALWASDLFVLPSSYEVHPMVSLEAAAAGLPLLVTPLHGVEDMLQEGVTGWTVERSEEALAARLRWIAAHPEALPSAGRKAAEAISSYSPQAFVEGWRDLLHRATQKPDPGLIPASALRT